ncbi:hypothetical protein ENSA5_14940 [Enhygromyxa salina]|uniref:Uncharacterized protein n=1 Tax=Enhygromyxa salina TaxID=215803 RepID=A0A2S9YEC2_9BACT|nr:hypothetical protein ENSA5_14940 [Enhygromyxa salina]
MGEQVLAQTQDDQLVGPGVGDEHVLGRRAGVLTGRERVEQRPHRLEAIFGRRRQPADEDRPQPRRDLGLARRRLQLAALDHFAQPRERVGGVGPRAVERLVERNTKRELIAGRVGQAAAQLLGGHVRGRTHERAGLCHARGRQRRAPRRGPALVVALDRARDTKVHHPHAPVVPDHHVVGLEVPVNDALGVSRSEPLARRHEHREDLVSATRRLVGPPRQPSAEPDPLDVGHDDEGRVLDLADLVDRHDVRVGELGHGLGLDDQASAQLGVALDRELLDRDLAVELAVVGGIDDAHRPPPELVEQLVVGEQRDLGLDPEHLGEQALPLVPQHDGVNLGFGKGHPVVHCRLAARGAMHRVASRRIFRRAREAKTPLYRAYYKFWRQNHRRKGQARRREALHPGLLAG